MSYLMILMLVSLFSLPVLRSMALVELVKGLPK
jgi:hypothetical protein